MFNTFDIKNNPIFFDNRFKSFNINIMCNSNYHSIHIQ